MARVHGSVFSSCSVNFFSGYEVFHRDSESHRDSEPDGSMTLKADGSDDVPKEGSVSQTLVPNGQPMLRLLLLLVLFLILSQR